MTAQLIEFLLGIYFVGISMTMTKTLPEPKYNRTVDAFKLILGGVLIVLALMQGVRFI